MGVGAVPDGLALLQEENSSTGETVHTLSDHLELISLMQNFRVYFYQKSSQFKQKQGIIELHDIHTVVTIWVSPA